MKFKGKLHPHVFFWVLSQSSGHEPNRLTTTAFLLIIISLFIQSPNTPTLPKSKIKCNDQYHDV